MTNLTITLVEETQCYELVIPMFQLRADPSPDAQTPGSVRRYPDGAVVLHVGPGRWLLLGSALERATATVVTAQACGGSLLDVGGKWLRLSATGTAAESHLSQFLNVTHLLHARGCAPVTILDCPAVLSRSEEGFDVWTTRSWAKWLFEMLTRST